MSNGCHFNGCSLCFIYYRHKTAMSMRYFASWVWWKKQVIKPKSQKSSSWKRETTEKKYTNIHPQNYDEEKTQNIITQLCISVSSRWHFIFCILHLNDMSSEVQTTRYQFDLEPSIQRICLLFWANSNRYRAPFACLNQFFLILFLIMAYFYGRAGDGCIVRCTCILNGIYVCILNWNWRKMLQNA